MDRAAHRAGQRREGRRVAALWCHMEGHGVVSSPIEACLISAGLRERHS